MRSTRHAGKLHRIQRRDQLSTRAIARQPIPGGAGLSALFQAAFTHSRNPMVLVDANRRLVDVNGASVRLLGYPRNQLIGRPMYEFVVGGPAVTDPQWDALLAEGRLSGEAEMRDADGNIIGVQFAASSEVVTGRYLVLGVALSTSRWGRHFRRTTSERAQAMALSRRELEIVSLVALGRTGPEIADELSITHDTVRTHVRNAMEKMDARSRAHLVAKALGDGTILGDALAAALPRTAPVP
jgi:PAS domain S-box-containing protein